MTIDCLIIQPGEVSSGGPATRASALALGLKEQGLHPAFISPYSGPDTVEGTSAFRLPYREQVLEGKRWSHDKARAYGVKNTQRFIQCELGYHRVMYNPSSKDELIAEVAAAFEELDQFFDRHDIKLVFHDYMGGEIFRQAATIIAKQRGIPVLYAMGTEYFRNMVLFTTDDQGSLLTRERLSFQDLPVESQDAIKAELNERTARRTLTGSVPPRTFSKLFLNFIQKGKFRNPARLLKAIQTARTFFDFARIKRKWVPFNPDANYLYYPLAHSNESVMILRSPKYYRQDFLLEFIGRMLPDGMDVVIKQHPHNPAEAMPPEMLLSALNKSHAKLIPAGTNNWDVMHHAKAILMVHGTTGFEALLMRKPVVVLGRPAYRDWGITFDVDDLDSFPDVLERALDSTISEDQLLDFLASFKAAHIPGNWARSPYDPQELAAGLLQAKAMLH